MNENQNVFMEGKRTTSRVTNEPGGKSSVQLGWDSSNGNKTGKKKRMAWTLVRIHRLTNISVAIVNSPRKHQKKHNRRKRDMKIS